MKRIQKILKLLLIIILSVLVQTGADKIFLSKYSESYNKEYLLSMKNDGEYGEIVFENTGEEDIIYICNLFEEKGYRSWHIGNRHCVTYANNELVFEQIYGNSVIMKMYTYDIKERPTSIPQSIPEFDNDYLISVSELCYDNVSMVVLTYLGASSEEVKEYICILEKEKWMFNETEKNFYRDGKKITVTFCGSQTVIAIHF